MAIAGIAAGAVITAGDRAAAAAIIGTIAGAAISAGAPMAVGTIAAGAAIIAGAPIIGSGGTAAMMQGTIDPKSA
jgi:hypothetical protein